MSWPALLVWGGLLGMIVTFLAVMWHQAMGDKAGSEKAGTWALGLVVCFILFVVGVFL